MKRLIVAAAILLFSAPAFAEGAKPTCGKDAAECQKVVDDLTQRLGVASLQVQGLQQQRNSQAITAMDTDLNAFIRQQEAAIAAQPKVPPK